MMDQCDLSGINCETISDTHASRLLAPVTPELILKTLKSMKRNKAPGPDGFTVEFFLAAWDTVGSDFCKAIMHFFATSEMHQGLNSTCIALIPKVQNPSSMRDFCPISLCTTSYKCIAKIIASRLQTVLPNVINTSQSTFIKGRSISDNILAF